MDRLKKRRDFLRVSQRGTRIMDGVFVVQKHAQKDDMGGPRLGFTVTKKVGNAVERNRIRRRLKAGIHFLEKTHGAVSGNDDYVVIARRGVLTLSFDRLLEQLKQGLYSIRP